jgi:hypothetical protein
MDTHMDGSDIYGVKFADLEYFSLYLSFPGYCLTLLLTWIFKKLILGDALMGPVGDKLVQYHNFFMTAVSVVLIVACAYFYYDVTQITGLPLYDFKGNSLSPLRFKSTFFMKLLLLCQITKVIEWVDTMWLIVRGKDLALLHCFHHSTILIAFFTGMYTGALFWIGMVNSFIHIIMYAYYAKVAFIKPYARYLTQLQLFQLAGGCFFNTFTLYIDFHENSVLYSKVNFVICFLYFCLFVRFYSMKYKGPKKDKNGKKEN